MVVRLLNVSLVVTFDCLFNLGMVRILFDTNAQLANFSTSSELPRESGLRVMALW